MAESIEALFVRFLAEGDEDALDQLFRRCSPPLRQLARRLGRSATDAEDLCQETMVVAIAAADRWDGERPLLPWLKGILARKAAQLAREDLRRQRLQDELAARCAATPPAAPPAGDHELQQALEHALTELPAQYQEPLALHLLQGHTPQEVAAVTGRSRTTIRVQLYRGLRLLRQKLPPGSAGALVAFLDRGAGAPGSRPWLTLPRLHLRGLRALHLGLLAGAACTVAACLVPWWPAERATPPTAAAVPAAAAVAAPPMGPDRTASGARTALPGPATVAPGLRIRVLDVGGAGIAHVGVCAAPAAGTDPLAHQRRGVTDADGELHLTLPEEPSTLHAWLLRTDRGVSTVLDRTREHVVTLCVTGGAAVRGRVLDPAGRPVPGARVWLSDDRDGPWAGADVTTTDAGGSFALAQVPAGAFLAARHARLGRSPVVRVAEGTPEVELRLGDPGGRVLASVRDALDRPLGDALVLVGEAMAAAPLRLAQGAAAWRPPPFELRSDAQGLATSDSLEPGTHPVFVRAPGHEPWASFVRTEPGTDTALTLRLSAGARLAARVLGPQGLPVAGAQLVFRGRDRHCDVDAVTDQEGCVRLDGLPAGEGRVAARAPGLRPRTRTLELCAGRPHELELTLDGQRAVPCVVRDADGAPMVGARLRARTEASSSLEDGQQVAEIDASGSVRLFVDPGRRAALELADAGAPLWRPVSAFTTWGPGGARIDLPRGFAADSWLVGKLTDEAGQPLAEARLHLIARSNLGDDDARMTEVARSGADGGFRIGPLPAGEFELFAETTNATSPSTSVGTVQLTAGETRKIAFRAQGTGVVDFVLRRSDGGDPGDVVVTIVGGTPRRRWAAAMAPTGQRRLQAGTYQLHVMGSRVRWLDGHPFTVRAGERTRVALDLEAATLCTLWLTGLPPAAGSEPARGRVLRLPDGEELGRWPVALDAPTPLAAVLPLGSYEIELLHPAGDAYRGAFTVTELLPSFRATCVDLVRR